jgi:hypothetical protein
MTQPFQAGFEAPAPFAHQWLAVRTTMIRDANVRGTLRKKRAAMAAARDDCRLR